MGFFDIFRKKRKARAKKQSPRSYHAVKSNKTLDEIRIDVTNLRTQIGTINIALKKHDDQLEEHTRLIGEHTKQLEELEHIVNRPPVSRPAQVNTPANNPLTVGDHALLPKVVVPDPAQRFDINLFSEQEKRILAVFFQNQGMYLSYADVAQTLNKSAHTVKNQMNQMRLKADLFDKAIGEQSRNRFKLKDSLRIEKYLNVA